MKILITGGTGFLGKHICQYFLSKNRPLSKLASVRGFEGDSEPRNAVYTEVHEDSSTESTYKSPAEVEFRKRSNDEITILTRNPNIKLTPEVKLISQLDTQEYFDIIINLAGEKINHKRWDDSTKKEIYDSRIETTRKIIEYIKQTPIKPRILLSGSAIGYYGTHKERIFTEKSISKGLCFPSKLCKDWEKEALKANEFGVRTIILRTGVVLAKDGGMVAELLPIFNLNLGTILGDGKQFISWIHIEDYLTALDKIIDSNHIEGPINMCSPNPCTNKEFSLALAEALNKKLFIRLPKFFVKLFFGEMGEKLLIEGQKIYPAKLIDLDFDYKFPKIKEALRHCNKVT